MAPLFHDDKRRDIAVITVHGTGDAAESDTGQKWWQRDSAFGRALLDELRDRGRTASHIAFHWSGANSELARRKGAEELARTIRKCRRAYTSTHIVAHSHGGNIADLAANLCGWARARRVAHPASIVAVGTPFLRRRISAFEYFSAATFLLVALLSIPLWIGTVMARFAETSESHDLLFWLTLLAGGTAIVLSIGLTLRTAIDGARRVALPKGHLQSPNAILSIRHPQDEAISFLQKVDTMRLEPIPRGALLRGSGNLAIALSTPIVNLVALALLSASAYFALSGESNNIAAVFALASCGLFCVLYLASRFLFGVLPECFLRGLLNNRIVNTVRGLALGSDGVQRLGNVSVVSHTLRTIESPLAEVVAERMKANAASYASQLINKYRWTLFTAGTDASSSLSDIAEDALTWDSLIHTTYFDQTELVNAIATHIAERSP